jgi:hypothetical protein
MTFCPHAGVVDPACSPWSFRNLPGDAAVLEAEFYNGTTRVLTSRVKVGQLTACSGGLACASIPTYGLYYNRIAARPVSGIDLTGESTGWGSKVALPISGFSSGP